MATQEPEEEEGCQHLTGYWINEPDHFRCYECGMQCYMASIPENPNREIQVWVGHGYQ